jgi:hypothetical protein
MYFCQQLLIAHYDFRDFSSSIDISPRDVISSSKNSMPSMNTLARHCSKLKSTSTSTSWPWIFLQFYKIRIVVIRKLELLKSSPVIIANIHKLKMIQAFALLFTVVKGQLQHMFVKYIINSMWKNSNISKYSFIFLHKILFRKKYIFENFNIFTNNIITLHQSSQATGVSFFSFLNWSSLHTTFSYHSSA